MHAATHHQSTTKKQQHLSFEERRKANLARNKSLMMQLGIDRAVLKPAPKQKKMKQLSPPVKRASPRIASLDRVEYKYPSLSKYFAKDEMQFRTPTKRPVLVSRSWSPKRNNNASPYSTRYAIKTGKIILSSPVDRRKSKHVISPRKRRRMSFSAYLETISQSQSQSQNDDSPSMSNSITIKFEETSSSDNTAPVVMLTKVNDSAEMQKMIEEIGGTVVHDLSHIDKVTCIVSTKIIRTHKFLTGVCKGKTFVHANWVHDSHKHNKFLDLSAYTLQDSDVESQYGFTFADAIVRAQASPLFQGLQFYLAPNSFPEEQVIRDLIQIAGGTIASMPSDAITVATQKASSKTVHPDAIFHSCLTQTCFDIQ